MEANTLEVVRNSSGTYQCGIDIRQDIFAAEFIGQI